MRLTAFDDQFKRGEEPVQIQDLADESAGFTMGTEASE